MYIFSFTDTAKGFSKVIPIVTPLGVCVSSRYSISSPILGISTWMFNRRLCQQFPNFFCSPLNLFPIQSMAILSLPFLRPEISASSRSSLFWSLTSNDRELFGSSFQHIWNITSSLILPPSLLDPSSFPTKITGTPSCLFFQLPFHVFLAQQPGCSFF